MWLEPFCTDFIKTLDFRLTINIFHTGVFPRICYPGQGSFFRLFVFVYNSSLLGSKIALFLVLFHKQISSTVLENWRADKREHKSFRREQLYCLKQTTVAPGYIHFSSVIAAKCTSSQKRFFKVMLSCYYVEFIYSKLRPRLNHPNF